MKISLRDRPYCWMKKLDKWVSPIVLKIIFKLWFPLREPRIV